MTLGEKRLSAVVVGTGFIGPVHNEGFPDTFKQLFRSFYGYVAAGDFTAPPPFPTFADGHCEVLLCEAVLRSAREGRWVEVGT